MTLLNFLKNDWLEYWTLDMADDIQLYIAIPACDKWYSQGSFLLLKAVGIGMGSKGFNLSVT